MLAGCHGLLGLDETVDSKFDADLDGVDDRHDNCLGVANADQADQDGDQLGDRCDPTPDGLTCPSGMRIGLDANTDGIDDGCQACESSENEDGDGVADPCDLCPSIPNETRDADGDLVGDGCDPAIPSPNRRILFDGFNVPLGEAWENPGWTQTSGTVVSTGIPMMSAYRVGSDAGDFAITTSFVLADDVVGKLVGLVVVVDANEYRCGMFRKIPGSAQLRTIDPSGKIVDLEIANPSVVDLRMSLNGDQGRRSLKCEVLGALATQSFNFLELGSSVALGLYAEAPTTTFTYADIVAR
jgi:hypothetical protein